MSGICGLARADGGPVEGAVLERLTSAIAPRGPDGRSTWLGASAGLGHTLLRIDDEGRGPAQPCTLEGTTWITADVRLDGRAELLAALAGAGRVVEPGATDAQLVLNAYGAWGESCVDHLLGDFAFAVWDAARRRLFCARDPMGVKPLFYALAQGELVFSNTLGCVRTHPHVRDELDDLAIADFLLFEMSQEPSATAFAAIRRLPPAHCLSFSADGLRIRRYWRLASQPIAEYRRGQDYLDRFDEILGAAVADRVGSRGAAVLMSGGLDSPALASAAVRRGVDVRAYCSVYDRLFADEERSYSTLAAAALRIPIAHRAADGYGLFERYEAMPAYFCEPQNAPFAALELDLLADAAAHSRIVVTGWDGDTLLAESPRPYLSTLARQGRWATLAARLAMYVRDHPGAAATSAWLRLRRARTAPIRETPRWPVWLNPDFTARLRLADRWRETHSRAPESSDSVRPYAHSVFRFLERSSCFFENGDPGRTGVAAEMRHPMMDLRLVTYCLSLPPVPWCVRKEILRRWLRGRVPEAVRLRPKAPLAGYPHVEALRREEAGRQESARLCAEAASYIDQGKMDANRGMSEPSTAWANLRPRSLDLWLRHARAAQ